MKQLKTRFDKHEIPNLPKALFGGRIITILSEAEAEKAVEYLLTQPILGFDTETKPRFKSGGGSNLVALLQVSTPDTCFLFRLKFMQGLPACIIRLLSDTRITKVGLSWHDDLMMLHHRADFQAGTFVEIQEMVKMVGIKDLSLQKIYANLFGERISKTQRLSNWEADTLTEAQQLYAATDAWACIRIYNELLRLSQTQDYTLEIIPEPEPPVPVEKKAKEEGKKRPASSQKNPAKPRRRKTEKKTSPDAAAGKEGRESKESRESRGSKAGKESKATKENKATKKSKAGKTPKKSEARKPRRKPQSSGTETPTPTPATPNENEITR